MNIIKCRSCLQGIEYRKIECVIDFCENIISYTCPFCKRQYLYKFKELILKRRNHDIKKERSE